jgi:hypothetical protein
MESPILAHDYGFVGFVHLSEFEITRKYTVGVVGVIYSPVIIVPPCYGLGLMDRFVA